MSGSSGTMLKQHIICRSIKNHDVAKGENMSMKKLGVAAILILCAASAFASNFRGADQVYLPIAGRAAGQSGLFITDVWISNLSSEPVDVSVIYQPRDAAGGPGTEFKNVIKLRGFERKEYLDFFSSALGLTSGVGQIILNGCLQGADCGPASQDADGFSSNYRSISAESRIYQVLGADIGKPNPPTTGQLFSGIPWYNFVSSLQSSNGLDKVFITGITSTDKFRTNIGLVNASQYSATTIHATLYQGTMTAADKKGEKDVVDLGPLGSVTLGFNAAELFPDAKGSNYFLVLEQRNNIAVGAPAGCIQGCPAFLAYGSMLDNVSGDATTLESQYLLPLTQPMIDIIYPNSSGKTSMRRSARH